MCVFVALVTQHAMRMRQIVNRGPAPIYNIFPRNLINGTIFEKKKKITEHKICVLIPLQLLSEIFLILLRTEQNRIKNILVFT